jgi:hypothetical protein
MNEIQINSNNYCRLFMFCSLYEITTYGQIAKQAFAKIPNSIVLNHDATREKVRWVVGGTKGNPHRPGPLANRGKLHK